MEFQRVTLTYGPHSEEMRVLKARKDFVDPPLNQMGIEQATKGQCYINQIKFRYVFVSPMIRTCMTTIYLFMNHPEKENIKFILLPPAKEVLNLCNDLN
jgi:broad specificity phosphatase PhoE